MIKAKNDIRTIKGAKERNFQVTLIRSFYKISLPFVSVN